jgi:hypothetical protein
MNRFLYLPLLAVVTACSMNQDPMAGQSESVRNGVPPSEVRQKPAADPLFADSLRIRTSVEVFQFQETIESVYSISGQALLASKDPVLEITNLSEFPGATFDEKNGTFKWTPTKGYNGGLSVRNSLLKVQYSVESTEAKKRISKTLEVPIICAIKNSEPSIVAIDNLSNPPIREGERRQFRVTVRDEDAQVGQEPRLMILPGNSSYDLDGSTLVNKVVPKVDQDANDKSLYKFTLYLDVEKADVTNKEDTFQFNLMAVSRFGITSQIQKVNIRVLTSVSYPVISLNDNEYIPVHAGQDTTISFMAMDPKSEGTVTVSTSKLDDSLGARGYACSGSGRGNNPVVCKVTLNPQPEAVGRRLVWNVQANNKSPIINDSAFRNTNKKVYIDVKPAVVPPPVEVNPPPGANPQPDPGNGGGNRPSPTPMPTPSPGNP